jgi:hypothetical protein
MRPNPLSNQEAVAESSSPKLRGRYPANAVDNFSSNDIRIRATLKGLVVRSMCRTMPPPPQRRIGRRPPARSFCATPENAEVVRASASKKETKQPSIGISRGRNFQNARAHVIEMSAEIGRGPFLQGLDTVGRGVGRVVRRGCRKGAISPLRSSGASFDRPRSASAISD